MDLNIRPKKNTYTNLTQPRQPRSRREARDNQSATLDTNTNINTPIIEQTTVIEPDNNSNDVITSTYIAKNSRTGEEIEFNLEDRRAMTRKMNISPIEFDDLISGVISSVKGWTVSVNTGVANDITNTITNDITNGITHHIKETSDNGVYKEANGITNGITNDITNTKISIVATHLKTGVKVNFESISQASEVLNIAQPSISSCINGRRKSACGWKFIKI